MLSVGTVSGEDTGQEHLRSWLLGRDQGRSWTPCPWSGSAARPGDVGGGHSQPQINHNF